jgi:hypothetical protein
LKVGIYIEDGLRKIVLTSETKEESDIISFLNNDKRVRIETHRGGPHWYQIKTIVFKESEEQAL